MKLPRAFFASFLLNKSQWISPVLRAIFLLAAPPLGADHRQPLSLTHSYSCTPQAASKDDRGLKALGACMRINYQLSVACCALGVSEPENSKSPALGKLEVIEKILKNRHPCPACPACQSYK